jgi:hypothetical protein
MFTEHEFGSAMGFDVNCPGWSADDAAASAVVAALREHRHQDGVWLECGWRVTGCLLRLMDMDLADSLEAGATAVRVDQIFGVEVRLTEGGDSAAWRLVTPAGPLAAGQVPR